MSTARRARGDVETATDAADPSLRGRTYAIPFEDVWQGAVRLAGGGLRRWQLGHSDDTEGLIRAETKRLTGAMYDATIRIGLDDNAQTRVDARIIARQPGRDFGTAKRMIRRFFRSLDRTLARTPRRGTAPHL